MNCAAPLIGVTDCGVFGITPEECLQKGCCYLELGINEIPESRPLCFYNPTPILATGSIIDENGELVGIAGEVPDMIDETEPVVPIIAADPTNVPERPTDPTNKGNGPNLQKWIALVVFLLIVAK